MATNLTVAQITTLRDNLVTAYTTLSTTPTTQYQIGDRMFTYIDRARIWTEIKSLTALLLLRDTTTNARGRNRMDLRKWD